MNTACISLDFFFLLLSMAATSRRMLRAGLPCSARACAAFLMAATASGVLPSSILRRQKYVGISVLYLGRWVLQVNSTGRYLRCNSVVSSHTHNRKGPPCAYCVTFLAVNIVLLIMGKDAQPLPSTHPYSSRCARLSSVAGPSCMAHQA